MRRAEDYAMRMDRWMLSLMTRRGSDAEALYRKLGWSLAGVIPDDSVTPHGRLCDAAIYIKRLR
jgi:acetyltransferase